MIRVEGKKGRRTIIGEGKSRPQAQARAMAEWRRVYGEQPKGVKFTVVSGGEPEAAPRKPKPKGSKPKGSKPDAKPAPKVPVSALTHGCRLVIGLSNAGTVRAFGLADSLEGARALVSSKAIDGSVHVITTLDSVYQNTGRQAEGAKRIDVGALAYRDRVVLATKASGELLDVVVVAGPLGRARAVAESVHAARGIVTTVHQAFQG